MPTQPLFAIVSVLSLACAASVASTASGTLERLPVDAAEAAAWQDHLVPLPKQVEIVGKVVVPAARVAVVGAEGRGAVLGQAARELLACLGQDEKSFTRPHRADLVIALHIVSPGTSRLDALPHCRQAYSILPDSDRSPSAIHINATTPVGLYYGSQTLIQLMRPRHKDGMVEVPLIRVLDWPDMEDRGLWGADCHDHIPWMAARKLNIVEQISDIGVDAQGKVWARLKRGREPMVTEGPQRGVKPVPVILHLEQLSGKGIFQAHPELVAVNSPHEGAICYSKPAFVRVLADWLVELCKLPEVNDIDVWLAENMQGHKGCQCPDCAKEDRSVLEAKVVAAAWELARKRVANLRIRVLTSEETESSNPAMFDVLPPEIKIWYYHSLLTYSAGKSPMLRDYLADFAKQGRWIGVCPNVVNVVHFVQPNTTPQFIHYRLNEFVDKGMSGIIGYATPRLYYGYFLVEAMAEWSWHAKGRTPREFARSWAVREGLACPERFAEWAELIGPVAWSVYGSDWPSGEQREFMRVAPKLREGKVPDLGYVLWDAYRSPWGDIKTVEQLNRNVEQADRAVEMAKELGRDEFIYESLIVQGYVRSLKALWELKQLVRADGVREADRTAARKYFRMYADGLNQAARYLPEWESTVPMRPADERFTERPLRTIQQVIGEMRQVASDLGCADD